MRFVKEPTAPLAYSSRPLLTPRSAVNQELKHELREQSLVDSRAVARALGMSERFVRSLVYRKTIPVIRLGRRLRFDLGAVLAAVKRFEIHEIGRY